MATNPDQHTETSLDDRVQNHSAPDEGGTNTNKPITAQEEGETCGSSATLSTQEKCSARQYALNPNHGEAHATR